MSQQDVRALIETRLKNWADDNDLALAVENVPFSPPSDAAGVLPYLKFNLLPALTRSDDLAGALRSWSGVAQITVFARGGKGPGEAEGYVKLLDALFPASTYIVGTTLSVLIATPVSAANGFPDEAYYAVPCSFQYRADISLN
jgi:hypothetical protein